MKSHLSPNSILIISKLLLPFFILHIHLRFVFHVTVIFPPINPPFNNPLGTGADYCWVLAFENKRKFKTSNI